MDKEQLLILREIIWQLNKKYPRVLTDIVENILDIPIEKLDEVMTELEYQTA